MPTRWSALITKAEKLLGGPAPFINLSSLLSSEAGFLAARARRLAATTDHPFFSAVRACLHGKSVSSLFPFSQNSSEVVQSTASSPYPSGGLIVLLVGQCRAGNAAGSTVLSNQHRSLAELFETVNMAITTHKSLVDPNKLQRNDSDELSEAEHDAWIKNLELGNKLATLAGDVLLASVSTTLAGFHSAKVVDVISEAIGDMLQAEFNPMALEFFHGHAPPEQMSEPPGTTSQPMEAISVTNNWLSYIGACRGSILGSCCQSAVLLSDARLKLPQSDNLQSPNANTEPALLARQLGHDWATLIRLIEERDFVVCNSHALSGRRISDLVWGTQKTPRMIGTAPGSFVNYMEAGLPQPTLMDAYLGQQVPVVEIRGQPHSNPVTSTTSVLREYSRLGLELSSQLKNSFKAFQSAVLASRSASERATSSAVELLREMVHQLSADAVEPAPETVNLRDHEIKGHS